MQKRVALQKLYPENAWKGTFLKKKRSTNSRRRLELPPNPPTPSPGREITVMILAFVEKKILKLILEQTFKNV